MKRKSIIIFLLISVSTFACQCVEFNKENIKEFKKSVDYIVIGTVVNNLNWYNNEFLDSHWKKENNAKEVVVKVERVLRGKLKSDYIYIYQLDAGNCARNFENGKKYILTGHQIKKFINLTPSQQKNVISNDTLTDDIPITKRDITKQRKEEYKNKRMYFSNVDFDFKKWNKLAKNKIKI